MKRPQESKALTLIVALLLAGCGEAFDPAKAAVQSDQCLRVELFKACMASLPKGPERIHNSNDWEEVVAKCDSIAYYQARRPAATIDAKCRIPQ